MRKKILKIIIIFGSIIFLWNICIVNQVNAIGVSPSAIVEKKILPDSQSDYIVFLMRSPSENEEITMQIHVRGNGAKYIIVPEEIILSAKSETKLSFSIKTSPYAAGFYQAFIDIYPKSSADRPSQISVLSGVSVPVDFFVENNNTANIILKDMQFDNNILKAAVQFKLKNTGAAETVIDQIKIEVKSKEGKILATGKYQEEKQFYIIPNEEKSAAVDLDSSVLPGKYPVSIKLYNNEKEIAALIGEIIKNEKIAENNSIDSSKNNLLVDGKIIIFICGSFFLTAIVVVIIKFNKKIKKSLPK